MKCFNHSGADAVGICKSCNRALCHECIAEVGTSCACKNRCESDVATINDVIVRGSLAYRKASGIYVRAGVFMLAMGLLFVGFGFFLLRDEHPNWFFVLLGALMMIYGAIQFLNAKRYRDPR